MHPLRIRPTLGIRSVALVVPPVLIRVPGGASLGTTLVPLPRPAIAGGPIAALGVRLGAGL